MAAATSAAMPACWVALRAPLPSAFLRLAAAGIAFAAAYVGITWAKGWLPAGWTALFRRARAPSAAAAPR
jgi:hypothetical protein